MCSSDPPPGIAAAAEHADGFVQQQGQRRGGGLQWPTIHQDPIASWIGLVAKVGGDRVHLHTPSAQQLLSAPARAKPCGGNQFLQAFGGQGAGRQAKASQAKAILPRRCHVGDRPKIVVPFRNPKVS